ncbi:transglycosylase SLT domain-containing protein [Gemmatimonas sp.]|uniref:transglycosylase SLT domain-containing protein n=1 Tax=Gemmatimonas sp. TaxID=1962908 RepID=UPI0033410670
MRSCSVRSLLLLLLLAPGTVLGAQPRADADRYDDVFRKATKRHFGPAFDWRLFKAQGMAESNIDATARSRVGARGVMQLMPGTFREVASKNPELTRIDDATSNIMAGVAYDRRLWEAWARDSVETDRLPFTLASYNAGRGTLLSAQRTARASSLDPRAWANIERVAPTVRRWRHAETLGYVRRIAQLHGQLDDRGRVMNGTTSARGGRAR